MYIVIHELVETLTQGSRDTSKLLVDLRVLSRDTSELLVDLRVLIHCLSVQTQRNVYPYPYLLAYCFVRWLNVLFVFYMWLVFVHICAEALRPISLWVSLYDISVNRRGVVTPE